MKRISFILFCTLFLFPATHLFPQTYLSQGFEGSFPPAGWSLHKQGGGTVKHWERTNTASHSGQYSAYHQYRSFYQDAWLVSPGLDLGSATYPVLSYWDAVLWPEDAGGHEVLISSSYIPGEDPWDHSWDTLTVSIGDNYWQHAANIPLADYLSSNVFIAWHYTGANGSNWYIDDVVIHEAGLPPINDSCQNATLVSGPYPVSVSGSNTWATFDCTGTLDFWNGVWYEITLPYSCNLVEMVISSLESNLGSAGTILATDCSCAQASYLYSDSSEFTTDTSIYIRFENVEGPGTVYIPLNIEPLQQFNMHLNITENCATPSDLDIVSFGETSVDLTWTEYGCSNEWEIEYGPFGFLPNGTPDITGIMTPGYQLANLTPGQCYQARVRSVCGEAGRSEWSQPISFCTNCPVVVGTFQYMWNYEPPIFPPNCWTLTSTSDSTWTYGYTLQSPATKLTFCNWHPTQVQNEWLITPPMDLSSLSTPVLGFNWMTSYEWMVDSNFADLNVLISLDGGVSWGDTLFSEDDQGVFNNWEWHYSEIHLSSYSTETNVSFAFVYTGTNGDAFAFDNLIVGPQMDISRWTGSVNSEWFNSYNWDNHVPTRGTDAHITDVSSTTGNPPQSNNTVHCENISVAPGGALTILAGTRMVVSNVVRQDHSTGSGGNGKNIHHSRYDPVLCRKPSMKDVLHDGARPAKSQPPKEPQKRATLVKESLDHRTKHNDTEL